MPGAQRRSVRTAYRREADDQSAKVWWHRDLAPAHTSRASATGGTMRRTLTSALPATTPGEQVRLQGWVHRRRELAKVTFLVVRDRSGLAQVVLPAGAELPPEETPVEVT